MYNNSLELIKRNIIHKVIENSCNFPESINNSLSDLSHEIITNELYKSLINSKFINEDLKFATHLLYNFFNRLYNFVDFNYKINFHSFVNSIEDYKNFFSLNEIFYYNTKNSKLLMNFSRNLKNSDSSKNLILSSKSSKAIKNITKRNKDNFSLSKLNFIGLDSIFNEAIISYAQEEVNKIVLSNIEKFNISLKISLFIFNINKKLVTNNLIFNDYIGNEYVDILSIIKKLEENIDIIKIQSDENIEQEIMQLKSYVSKKIQII